MFSCPFFHALFLLFCIASYALAYALVNPKYIAPLKLSMKWGEGVLRALSFSAASLCRLFSPTFLQFSGTEHVSSLREPELTPGAFDFRCNSQMKISYALALVLVNPKYINPLKLTKNWGEGALRARSFSATSPPAIFRNLEHAFFFSFFLFEQ